LHSITVRILDATAIKTPKHSEHIPDARKKRGWFHKKEEGTEETHHHLHVEDIEEALEGLE